MNHDSPFVDRVRGAFQPDPKGVVGLVDNLLALSRGGTLRLDFQDGLCHVRLSEANPPGPIDVPLPKSVFRAILARIAALCNERVPNSVSPYQGEGELAIGTSPSATFRVEFTNTAAEQHLEVCDPGAVIEEPRRLSGVSSGDAGPSSEGG